MAKVPIYDQNQVGVSRTPQKVEDRSIMSRLTENSNILDQWELDTLHDPDNGYLNVMGKAAVWKSQELLKSYDEDNRRQPEIGAWKKPSPLEQIRQTLYN